MTKKRKNIICCLRNPNDLREKGNGSVGRDDVDEIYINFIPRYSGEVEFITGLTSRDARLLAKRINQFLDAGG